MSNCDNCEILEHKNTELISDIERHKMVLVSVKDQLNKHKQEVYRLHQFINNKVDLSVHNAKTALKENNLEILEINELRRELGIAKKLKKLIIKEKNLEAIKKVRKIKVKKIKAKTNKVRKIKVKKTKAKTIEAKKIIIRSKSVDNKIENK